MIEYFLAALIPFSNPVDAILTDIEGTTTSISYVHDTLFPYAKEHLEEYVSAHKDEDTIVKILNEVKELAQVSSDEVLATLLLWIEQDKKIGPLKALQGLIWEDGYNQGAFQGHVYSDAYMMMHHWKEQGLPISIYSSGSVHAQKLLFSHSNEGDLTYLFSSHFDTKVGGKKESTSYRVIAEEMGISPEQILFLSDSVEELDAAKEVGMQTILLNRDNLIQDSHGHQSVANFYEIPMI